MTDQFGLEQTIRDTGVFRCLECGKCTAVCPISRYDHHFSPRRTVGRALMRHDEALLSDERLWACITCLQCSQVCPSAVDYTDLTLGVRTEARKLGAAAVCTHGEAIHVWMRLMMDPDMQQNRLRWLEDDESRGTDRALRVSEDSNTLYFVGCAPYYDTLFQSLGLDGDGIARSTVEVLNALGIEPQVLADERCCGHDLLWEGDVDGFRRLAELNLDMIQAAGVERIVSACPECVRALKVDYPAHGLDLGVEVMHLAELAAESELRVANGELRVTYQDPCRLGRHLGVYDAPRQIIEGLGFELREMQRHGRNALCCGTNGWTHCGAANQNIQADRLREAEATGADLLVTACIKCQIHFLCATEGHQLVDEVSIEIKDLATLMAERLV